MLTPRLAWPQLAVVLLLFVGPAPAALADDGVVEINQAAAAAGGITPGDAPGFPVTLSRSGSYRLTSNLATSSRSTSAVVVDASDVSIDLNGFAIACTFATGFIPVGCLAGTGPGVGIDVAGGAARVSVRNGSVREMGSRGIRLGSHSSVENVKAFNNGDVGISVGEGGRVARCTAAENGNAGIATSFYALVVENGAYDNGAEGLRVGSSSVVRNNVSRGNGDDGISAPSSVVESNQVLGNGGVGIRTVSGGTVSGNRVFFNAGGGLLLTNSGYVGNVMTSNANILSSADEVSGGSSLGINLCDGSPCP